MNKEKVGFNDVIESLTIKTNDYLRGENNKNNKDSALFWIFKFLIVVLFILLINYIFKNVEVIGVELIYYVAKSLRSILSGIWIGTLGFLKSLIIVYILYDNFVIFVKSKYYKSLYKNDKEMRKKKELVFKIMEILLKIHAVVLMIVSVTFGLVAFFGLVTLIMMATDNIYVISPYIICVSLLIVSCFTFLHIKSKFFCKKTKIRKEHFIIPFIIFVFGVAFFGYEISSYEKLNTLPEGMSLTIKEEAFKLNDNQKVYIDTNTKLNNIFVLEDNTLENEIRVEVEYYKTAKVSYSYEYNDKDDLKLKFSSELDLKPEDFKDIFNLGYKTFSRKAIYNYNLFKYPNIYVYANKYDMSRVEIK